MTRPASLVRPARRPGPSLRRSLLRLFTVQGSWNYERMQGIGMGVAEEPLLRDLQAALVHRDVAHWIEARLAGTVASLPSGADRGASGRLR